jgi:very-short-patch-repair endonuclease
VRFQERGITHGRERYLRRNSTPAERRLWSALRTLRSFKFRRQHRIRRYVVDFYCPSVRLVIEVDGGVHAAWHRNDDTRDHELRALGIRILRVSNDDVLLNLGEIVKRIDACAFL